jgi:hypothetical protein
MPTVPGRAAEGRTVLITTTSASETVTTTGAFTPADVGQAIAGTGIPAGATVAAVVDSTTATLSAPADADGTTTAAIGIDPAAAGWFGWVPTSDAEATSYSVAAAAGTGPDDRMTDSTTGVSSLQRARAS